jgi:hypothetical protein
LHGYAIANWIVKRTILEFPQYFRGQNTSDRTKMESEDKGGQYGRLFRDLRDRQGGQWGGRQSGAPVERKVERQWSASGAPVERQWSASGVKFWGDSLAGDPTYAPLVDF